MHREEYYNEEATRILKGILARRAIDYRTLAQMLTNDGTQITDKALANRLNRGTFTFGFAIQVMRLLEIDNVDVSSL